MLTDVSVRNAKATDRRRKIYDADGLYLIVTPGGGKWWRLKYTFSGKEKLLSLGVYPNVSLRQARERRDENRRLIADGKDPSVERRDAVAAQKAAARRELATFESIGEEWLRRFSDHWVAEHLDTVKQRLKNDVYPWIGGEPIAEIDAVRLLEVLRRIEARGAVSVAHRTKGIISQIFRFGIATGKAPRDPTSDLRGALTPERGRHFGAVTKPADIARLVRAIQGYSGSFVVRSAMKFSAYTFARPGEVRKAEWTEFDLDNAIWRVPAARMKTRREHLVPLSSQAVALLLEVRQLTGLGTYVFPGRTLTRPMSENAITAALRYLGFERGSATGATAHGFRRTASTCLNEMGFPSDWIEKQLAHSDKDKVRSAYNAAEHLDGRIEMMAHWAGYLDKLVAGGDVIPLRAHA